MPVTKTIPLTDPVAIGKQVCTELVLTEVTTAIILDANEESEKLVMGPTGPALVSSPALMGRNVLRRQIASIGGIKGPVDLTILKRLSPGDFAAVQAAADELDLLAAQRSAEALQALGDRGRSVGQDG